MTLQERFDQAQNDVKTLPKAPGNDVLLRLYALFKQGSMGDVTGKRPGMLDVRARFKYDSWAALAGTPRETAMEQYVALVESLLAGR